jgi:hypothetical protein
MKKLQVALSRQERIRRIRRSLDKLKANGEVTAEDFESMSANYDEAGRRCEQELAAIRDELVQRKEKLEREKAAVITERKNLDLRHKVGEIDVPTHDKKKPPLERRLRDIETRLQETETLLQARQSADVGGYLEVPLDADSEGVLGKLKGLDFNTEFVRSSLDKIQGVTGPLAKAKFGSQGSSKLGLIANCALAIAVFLPFVDLMFASVSLKGVGQTLKGIASFSGSGGVPFEVVLLSNAWWVIFLIGGLAVAANFLAQGRYARTAMIASGGVVLGALVVSIVAMLAEGGMPRELGIGDILGAIGVGFYILVIASITSIVAGVRYRPVI